MAVETIGTNLITPYLVDDNDVVTLLPTGSMTSPTVGFVGNIGLDSFISNVDLILQGPVVTDDTSVVFGNILDVVNAVRIRVEAPGSILSLGNAIELGSADSVLIENGNIIDAVDKGIEIDQVMSTVTVRNTGVISADNAPAIHVVQASTGTLRIENSGTIETNLPIAGATISAADRLNLINSGTVNTATGAGVAVASAGRNDRVVNTGSINGDVSLGDGRDVVWNSDAMLGDVLLGDGNDRFIGTGTGLVSGTVSAGAGQDTLLGSDLPDRLEGDGDGDLLSGRGGGDTLLGGAGSDRIYGGPGADSISGDGEADTINGNAGQDVVEGGDGADFLRGGSDGDTIRGAGGDDTIRGDGGDDRIVGGAGRDDLHGGGGSDVFVFEMLNDSGLSGGEDRILDFRPGHDMIDLSALAAINFTFLGADAFSITGLPEVRVVTTATDTLIQIDADGDGASDSDILLVGILTVDAADFVL